MFGTVQPLNTVTASFASDATVAARNPSTYANRNLTDPCAGTFAVWCSVNSS